MGLEIRLYSVLLVSSAESFNKSALELLPTSKYSPVVSTNVSEAKRYAAEHHFDFIIINSPLPDDNGIRFCIDCSRNMSTVVMLLVRSDYYAEVHNKVVEYGVFTLPKPTSKPMIIQSLEWLASAREKLRKLEKKSMTVEQRMEEIRIVNRAKILLISELKMTEQEAHRYIEKQAMDSCATKKEISENIINKFQNKKQNENHDI